MAVHDLNRIIPIIASLVEGESHAALRILPIGTGKVGVEHYAGFLMLILAEDTQVDVGLHAELMIEIVNGVEDERTGIMVMKQTDPHPMGFVGGRGWQDERLPIAEQGFPCLLVFRFSRAYVLVLHRAAGVVLWRGECQHADVAPVLPVGCGGHGKHGVYLTSGRHIRAAHGQMAHGLLGTNPRTAARGPSGTCLQAEAQPQAMGLTGGVAHQFLPLGAQAFDMFLRAGPIGRVADFPMKELYARDTGRGNGLQVFLDTGMADVAVHEVEPRLGVEDTGRTGKVTVVLRVEGTAEQGRVGHGRTGGCNLLAKEGDTREHGCEQYRCILRAAHRGNEVFRVV